MKAARPKAQRVALSALLAPDAGPFHATFFALLTGYLIFAYSSTDILRFPDRPMGIGLLGGVDASRRFTIYALILALSLSVWLGFHYGSRLLQRRLPSWFVGVRSRLENDLCATLSAVGSVALVARVAADRLDGVGPVVLAVAGWLGVSAIALTRRLSTGTGSRLRRQLTAWSALAPLLLWPWPSAQIAPLLGKLQGLESMGTVLLATILPPVGYALALSRCQRAPGRWTAARWRRAFALGPAPFFLLPSLCPVANEMQYALARRHTIDPRSIALVLLALLTVAAAGLFWLALKGQVRFRPGRLISRFYFPAIAFGSTLIAAHQHQLYDRIDVLHDGEQINAVYQLLRFDQWPFVDVWPAHGLSDYRGALYALVNGFRPFEITAWNGLLLAFAATATYALLAVVSTPFFAFALAILLPMDSLYAEPAFLGIGLLTCWALNRPSPRRYASLSVASFFCFFWAPTIGVASILSVFILLVFSVITSKDRRPAQLGLGIFVATGMGVFFAYILLLVACGRPVLETLRLILAFIQADPMVGGRATIIHDFQALAFFQYVVLPGVGMLYMVQLARKVIERRPFDRLDHLLGFLTLASFVAYARTLSRHGLVESYSSFFFPLLAMTLPMHRQVGRRVPESRTDAGNTVEEGAAPDAKLHRETLARVWFCVALALYWIICPVQRVKQLTLEPFDLYAWKDGEARFKGRTPDYMRVKAFLDVHMRPSDTFLEMLNAPLLYSLLEREVPGNFFLPTMFYATDRTQDIYLKRLAQYGGTERVPFALLPVAGSRANIDKIPNTARSYRIAEHVYRNYVLLGILDGLEVWVSRARWDAAGKAVEARPLRFAEPESHRAIALTTSRRDGDTLWLQPNGPEPFIDGALELGGVTLGGLSSPHAVSFFYRTPLPGMLRMSFRYGDGDYVDSGKVTLQASASDQWQRAELAIPVRFERELTLTGVRIAPPGDAELEIKGLELVYGAPPAATAETFSAEMLPFIWGNFDTRLGSGQGTSLESLTIPEATRPQRSFELKLSPRPDKSSGNYLQLCVRIPGVGLGPVGVERWQTVKHAGGWQSAGTVTLRYGLDPPSTFEFDLVRPSPFAPGLPADLASSFARECKRYLIRLSAQYAWNSQAVSLLQLESSTPILLEAADLLKGD
jgi:hypothetical protein